MQPAAISKKFVPHAKDTGLLGVALAGTALSTSAVANTSMQTADTHTTLSRCAQSASIDDSFTSKSLGHTYSHSDALYRHEKLGATRITTAADARGGERNYSPVTNIAIACTTHVPVMNTGKG